MTRILTGAMLAVALVVAIVALVPREEPRTQHWASTFMDYYTAQEEARQAQCARYRMPELHPGC